LQLLKIRTKEVLYEKYRTEKLLARRATRQISEEQRQRLLEGKESIDTLYYKANDFFLGIDLGL
jgi:septin family protein